MENLVDDKKVDDFSELDAENLVLDDAVVESSDALAQSDSLEVQNDGSVSNQNNIESCMCCNVAFKEGHWTLVASSFNVDVYYSHNIYKNPRYSQSAPKEKKYDIRVYWKIVNKNDFRVTFSNVPQKFRYTYFGKDVLYPAGYDDWHTREEQYPTPAIFEAREVSIFTGSITSDFDILLYAGFNPRITFRKTP